MEETISKEAENNIDPVMDFLLEIITKYNDYDLGKILRGVYIPLKVIVNDSPDT
jgi:methenyltetrahydromethanopterin cyclohydrolase